MTMLTVFAKSFMTATRINAPRVRDAPKQNEPKRSWLPDGHWWKETRTEIDLNDL
ncbi:MAG: hypothetical protein ACR2O2_04295 [Ruegeria sp.]